jgi:uncharacterized protein (DUF433 family)
MNTQLLGNGMYTIAEAARLTQLNASRLRSWFLNLFGGDYDSVDGDRAISFLDLIDALVAGKLRNEGVSLQSLRRVYKRLEDDFATSHPFCRRELFTDGLNVFVRIADKNGDERLIEILTRQHLFPRVILPYLKKIDYDMDSSMAKRWNIASGVAIDPQVSFGKPIEKTSGIATYVLASAYEANHRNANLVAQWYDVSPKAVLAAVNFERKL